MIEKVLRKAELFKLVQVPTVTLLKGVVFSKWLLNCHLLKIKCIFFL